MPNTVKKWGSAIVASLTVAAMLSACGSSVTSAQTKAGKSKTHKASASAPGVTVQNKTITVGTSAPMTGSVAYYGQIANALQAYFKYTNAQGGVDGWKIKDVLLDDKYVPTTALANSKELVQTDHVFAVVCSVGTGTNAAAVPYLAKQDVTVLPDTGQESLNKYKNVFSIEPASGMEAGLDTEHAIKDLHDTKIGVIYENDTLGRPALAGIKAVAQADGASVVATIAEPVTASDFGPAVSKLAQSKAQAVLLWGANAWLASVRKAAQALGYSPNWFGPFFWADPSTYKLAGSLMAGTYFGSWLAPLAASTPGEPTFVSTMQKDYPKDTIGAVTEQGWAMGNLFTTAVKDALSNGHGLTEASLQAALGSMRNVPIQLTTGVTIDKATGQYGSSGEVIQEALPGDKYKAVTKTLPFPPAAEKVALGTLAK